MSVMLIKELVADSIRKKIRRRHSLQAEMESLDREIEELRRKLNTPDRSDEGDSAT